MIDAGDLYLSDLGGEVRELVLVVSAGRFHRLSVRAIVCPAQAALPPELPPWWIPISGTVFAVDQMLTLRVEGSWNGSSESARGISHGFVARSPRSPDRDRPRSGERVSFGPAWAVRSSRDQPP